MISIFNKKKELRIHQTNKRKKIKEIVTNIFNEELFEELFNKPDISNAKIISSFISINSEINTRMLNNYILKKNKKLCLPVILKKNEPLVFREYRYKDNMVDGFMKIKEPPITNAILIPDIFFVPCLAFDKFGYRLGYGGGYYDRTFSFLKKNKIKLISVGYAYDGQKVSELPKDNFDINLDYVITEKKIYSYK